MDFLTIVEASELLRTRKISAVELVREHLTRIDASASTLHAYITVLHEQAIEEAAKADDAIQAGRVRMPLLGIPIAHKDNLWTKGVRTTANSHLFADWVPSDDATVVAKLRNGGAVCLGKTNLHELACGTPGPDELFPAAVNPWNLGHSPGSSSSGSAAAVAAGLCMAATGSDTGGSIAHPSTACGIVGMKPTFGRVSKHGLIPLADTLDHVGPFTRCVADSALMLQAMAGHDHRDPFSAGQEVPDFSQGIGQPITALRLGVPWHFLQSVTHLDETLRLFRNAISVLQHLGATVVEVHIPGLERAVDVTNLILLYEAYRHYRADLQRSPHRFGTTVQARLAVGATYSDADYASALRERDAIRQQYKAVLADGISAVISPAREGPADSLAFMRANPMKRSSTNRMYNLTGMPVLTVPMGFASSGLPIGITFAGDHFDEATVYRIGYAYEQACDWHRQHPQRVHATSVV